MAKNKVPDFVIDICANEVPEGYAFELALKYGAIVFDGTFEEWAEESDMTELGDALVELYGGKWEYEANVTEDGDDGFVLSLGPVPFKSSVYTEDEINAFMGGADLNK